MSSISLDPIRSRSPWTAIAYHLAPLFPVLLLPVTVTLLDPSWIYTPLATIDSWVYFGISNNFDFATKYFSDTYYWTRFSWTVPGVIFHRLSDPLTAKYLWHLSFFYAAIVALYAILRMLASYRVALIGTAVLAFDRFFLGSMGVDYVSGGFAAYILLALCFLTAAVKRSNWMTGYFLAGVFLGLTINLYPALVVLLPSFVLYALVLQHRFQGRPSWRSALAATLGLGGSVAGLMAFNWYFTGSPDYFSPSIAIARNVLEAEPWAPPPLSQRLLYALVPTLGFFWLHLPFLTSILLGVALAAALKRKQSLTELQAAATAYYGSSFMIMLLLETVNRSSIWFPRHFSYLYPGMYLALSALIGRELTALTPRVATAVWWALALGGGAIVAVVGTHQWTSQDEGLVGYLVLPVALIYAGAGVIWSVLEVRSKSSARAGVACSTILAVAVTLGGLLTRAVDAGNMPWGLERGREPDATSEKRNMQDAFLTVADGVRHVESMFPGQRPYFMYDFDAPNGTVGNAINAAYFWEYTKLTARLPALDCETADRLAVRRVVVMGPQPNDGEAGLRALEACGFTLREVARRGIEHGEVTYNLFFYETAKAAKLPSWEGPLSGHVTELSFEPPTSATVGETIEVTIAVESHSVDLAWIQLAVNHATDGETRGEWTILGTQPVSTHSGRATFLWDSQRMAPGEHRLAINIGLANGEVLWWYEQSASPSYSLR